MQFDQEALIRAIGVSQTPKYMLLLGSGASASSGVPTASQCIWEWKREIYLSENPSVSASYFLDVTLPSVQQKIQNWLDDQKRFPPADDPDEYGFYIEYTYPNSSARQEYFKRRFSGGIPQVGYQLLAMVQNSFVFQWIWTANFDELVNQGRKPTHTLPLKEIGLDTTFRLRDIQEHEKCCYLVHLHGDYRYDRLKNTIRETQELDKELRQQLVYRVQRQPLIVIGYGGRDESVMRALETAVEVKSAGGAIYWCVMQGGDVPAPVESLIEKAKANGYEAHIVEIQGFDDLMIRLARYLYRQGPEAREVEAILSTVQPERSTFAISGYRPDEDWLFSNGYLVELPRELYQFEADGIFGWKDLRAITDATPVVAGLLRGKILAIGNPVKINELFAGRLRTKIELVPLDENGYSRSDTVISSILLEALQRALAHETGLATRGKRILWDSSRHDLITYRNKRYKAFPAVKLSFNRAAGLQFLNLVPDLHVMREDGYEAGKDAVQEVKRQLLGKQWNEPYYKALEEWRERFLGSDDSRSFSYPPAASNGFRFRLSLPAARARILSKSSSIKISQVSKTEEVFEAIVLPESELVFGSARGYANPKDSHPIRGLVKDGPYDLQLTQLGVFREIRLGVVCASGYEDPLSQFLAKLLVAHPLVETKSEYLLSYPGFQQAYRIPLKVPTPGDVEWRSLPAIVLNAKDQTSAQQQITRAITREIDSLVSIASVDVILVFVPSSWTPYEVVENEVLRLDLHDFVKAYCAQKGIRTQILRESTLEKYQQCEVLWWLAQAIYVKSFRTPFVLNTNDLETVFVGIGYGLSRVSAEGGIVLGCSHIYNAAGQGLRYQLSRIQNPIWKFYPEKNPYLSKDDAIHIGTQARQLFYETYQKLPRRVVIHKRTPFLMSEREGLKHALKDVKELEMLTIEYEDSWRFIAYNKWKKNIHPFPIRRGTLVLLGPHEFLLWVHGTVRGFIENNKSYYQGKSRIPVPLKVVRYAGHSPVEQVANEILGLSKMNLNHFDLYSQLPATLESSAEIARVGQLLSRFGPETYDYRLFI